MDTLRPATPDDAAAWAARSRRLNAAWFDVHRFERGGELKGAMERSHRDGGRARWPDDRLRPQPYPISC
jgi:hypothetical protein